VETKLFSVAHIAVTRNNAVGGRACRLPHWNHYGDCEFTPTSSVAGFTLSIADRESNTTALEHRRSLRRLIHGGMLRLGPREIYRPR
jgi:hypothetical protein